MDRLKKIAGILGNDRLWRVGLVRRSRLSAVKVLSIQDCSVLFPESQAVNSTATSFLLWWTETMSKMNLSSLKLLSSHSNNTAD